MSLFIGLGHYSETGKDTFADFLVTRLISRGITAVKKPFAWKLKQICHSLYGWDGHRQPAYYDTPEGRKARHVKLPNVGKTPLELWISMGTDAVRDNVYDRTWLDYLLKSKHDEQVIIIPDVRFPNEADSVLDAGGYLVKVIRPGYGPRDTVPDRALLNYTRWNRIIGEQGTIEALEHEAILMANTIQAALTLGERQAQRAA